MKARGRDDGFAALAAVLASACFALVAAQVARTSRSGIVDARAAATHARLAADADAGLAIALDHILADDPGVRWDIDGQTYETPFGDADLHITIEDERGKLPLNQITENQARAMFQLAGADPSNLDTLVSALMSWRDPDKPRTAPGYASLVGDAKAGVSGFRTVQELQLLAGMTPPVYAAIAPFATVDSGATAFDARTASPFALQVMAGGQSGVAAIEREREAAGQRAAFEAAPPPVSLVSRILTIRVQASDPRGDKADDATMVQITGRKDRPYIVRQHYA